MSTRLDAPVVLGVDESVLEGRALRWAAEQAHLEGRRLMLVNACGPVSGVPRQYGMGAMAGASPDRRRRGVAVLGRARAELRLTMPDVDIDLMFQVAEPRTLLIELSESAHLLVLGSRGRGSVRSHLLGSVGLALLRHSACPVVVHRPGRPGRVRRGVVVALDVTEDSTAVLHFAFRQASFRRRPLKIVHFVHDVRPALVGGPLVGDLSESTELEAPRVAEALAGFREQFPDVHVDVETPRGAPAEGLAALSNTADLTVVGSHQRGLLGRLFAGSVSGSLIEHGHGPIAVVPVAHRL